MRFALEILETATHVKIVHVTAEDITEAKEKALAGDTEWESRPEPQEVIRREIRE